MSIHNKVSGRRSLSRVTTPVIAVLLTVAVGILALLFWSAVRTDNLEFQRRHHLVDDIVTRYKIKLATTIEAHTTWDETTVQLRKPVLDLEWADGILGAYLLSSSGVEETYVLDNRNVLLYSAKEGRRVSRDAFDSERKIFTPLVRDLRLKMKDPQKHLVGEAITPSVVDYAAIHGHPAMVAVKPITPIGTTVPGKIGIVRSDVPDLKPGEEYIHISVRRMDEKSHLLKVLRDEHLFERIRFSWTADKRSDEGIYPIRSPRTGQVVGYYLWEPFKPGSVVLKDMILPLLIGLALIGFIVFLLIRRIRRSTTELMASEAHARHLAFHDVLTGLPNRALFDDRLDRALAAARRHPSDCVALFYLDLDRFKKVNDTLGHPAGDELIQEVAKRLTDVIRENDTVARLGGDEFAIIQTKADSDEAIKMLCERIIEAIAGPFDLIGSQVFVGVSIGVARSAADGFDRTELSRKADIALYDAKTAGRGRHSIFAENMDSTIQTRRTIESDLRSALDAGDQLWVSYQPKYDAGSQAIVGVEALVRWNHPTKGLLSPVMFVPVAEETGLVEPLGEWVLEQACAAALLWPSLTISVNVSAVQLRNPFFAHKVLAILKRTKLGPSRLELEITETSFLESVETCVPNLKILRAVGVRIALDDFGTGYSSFTHLRTFDVDRIKIDKSFTTGIDSSDDSNAIIKAIVGLAHSTGIKITAEGVETMRQSKYLSAVGCDELQGFLMSHPLSLKDMDGLLGVKREPIDKALLAA